MMRESDDAVLVLYYHRINKIKGDPWKLCVSKENFESHMRYICQNYNVIGFSDSWNSQKKSVVITFDDGYADNLCYALPILEKFEVPATIFVSTGQILKHDIMWWDELYELIVEQNINNRITIQDEIWGCSWKTNSFELKMNCYYAIHKLMNHYISLEKKENWMQQLRQQICVKKYHNDYTLLTPKELKLLSESDLITIGGHTVSHLSLGNLSYNQQEIEIKDNLTHLQEIIGQKITVLSYPFGTEGIDVNKDTEEICKKSGIAKAATTSHKIWRKGNNPLMIPRFEVKNWCEKEFIKKIDEFWRK